MRRLENITSVLDLTERQLQEWKQWLSMLRESNPHDVNIDYCEAKIEELEEDIERLKS
ncbi:hypothetical protein WBJ53_26010 [Spirosoma sp. SC4-14]|uniref:hypothetical protein n=1 Tax=Spirosoma sp. SC4-14 TaxID=3128900 RepID=UPI0030CC2F4A